MTRFLARLASSTGQSAAALEAHSVPLVRRAVARRYLRGQGIEIGALHNPLEVPPSVSVRYVDRLPVEELRAQYPELAAQSLVEVDAQDDGERLARFSDASEDFVIANHFLEHCEDPVGALTNMLRVLRPGGVVYLAVPDKRHTFDRDRPVTSVDHVVADHVEGSQRSRRDHFEEWVRLVNKTAGDDAVEHEVAELMRRDYSIHYHVWTQNELLALLVAMRERCELAFDIALLLRNEHENIVVLQKLA
ncbi:MAG: methyltransferase domain-containing protein [Gaiellaceae bacterium]